MTFTWVKRLDGYYLEDKKSGGGRMANYRELQFIDEVIRLKAEIERKDEALKVALEELTGLWSFVGNDLWVDGWHENSNMEPFDNFFFDSDMNARHIIEQALQNKDGE